MVAKPVDDIVWLRIDWPRPLDPNEALRVLRQWAADQRFCRLVLEVRADAGGVWYLLGVPPVMVRPLIAGMRDLVPGTLLSGKVVRADVRRAGRLQTSTKFRALRPDAGEDITRAVLTSLAVPLKTGELLVLQVILGPARAAQSVSTATAAAIVQPWWRAALTGTATDIDSDDKRALRTKLGEPSFGLSIRVGVVADDDQRQRQLLLGVLAGLRTAQSGGIRLDLKPEFPKSLNEHRAPCLWPMRLNIKELLGITGWPLGDDPLPGLPPKHPRQLPLAERLREKHRIVGISTAAGSRRPLGLSVKDALQHTHVLGPTGTGKSTLLLNLILADITAGHGVIVIDPKGDLVNDILARLPQHRADDVVVLDPADDSPSGLNPLRNSSPEVATDSVLAVFKSLYADSWGPRTEDILTAAIATLARRPDSALTHLPLLLTNPNFRRSVIGGIDDPIGLGPFWAWYDNLSDGERQAAIASPLNKVRPFIARPAIRAVIGQVNPSFHMNEVFTNKKVLLVSLSKGTLGGETAALLGSLAVAQAWQATLGRATVPASRRHPVMIYIDELQDYLRLPTDLADALAQARSYGVGFTMAHQFMNQLSPAMSAAIMANARSRICFQLSPKDAPVMAALHPRLEPADFQALPAFHIYASLTADGQVIPFASGKTQPPPTPVRDPSSLRAASRARYGQPLAATDAALIALADSAPGTNTVGRRPRSTS